MRKVSQLDAAEDQQIYRYWIELRDLREGSVRVLPLQAFKLVHLITKKGAPQLPDESSCKSRTARRP